tara:strand:- start:279 stop:569 length:291 start_codon:yes stop_codon:yes gene_type:complete
MGDDWITNILAGIGSIVVIGFVIHFWLIFWNWLQDWLDDKLPVIEHKSPLEKASDHAWYQEYLKTTENPVSKSEWLKQRKKAEKDFANYLKDLDEE